MCIRDSVCGNSFLLKPSEQDPRPAALIVEIVDSIEEIPPGVVNLVHGGRDAVGAILADPGIDAVSFVGRALPAIIGSAFGAAGQRCLAGSVCVIVGDGARQAEVREALVAAASALRVGPGDDPDTDVCPMISAAAREKVAEAVGRAEDDGAELLLDGRGETGPAGTLLGPTILAVSDHESEPAREELFGPLLTVVGVADLDKALEFLNGSRYG